MPSVKVKVVLDSQPENLDGAILTLKIDDVGLMDGPSTIIAHATYVLNGDDINDMTFSLATDAELDEKTTYSVSAHVSLHPDDDPEEIHEGDYLTMQSYPVLTQDNPTELEVVAKRVG